MLLPLLLVVVMMIQRLSDNVKTGRWVDDNDNDDDDDDDDDDDFCRLRIGEMM